METIAVIEKETASIFLTTEIGRAKTYSENLGQKKHIIKFSGEKLTDFAVFGGFDISECSWDHKAPKKRLDNSVIKNKPIWRRRRGIRSGTNSEHLYNFISKLDEAHRMDKFEVAKELNQDHKKISSMLSHLFLAYPDLIWRDDENPRKYWGKK